MIQFLFIILLLYVNFITTMQYNEQIPEEPFCTNTSSCSAVFSNEYHASQILLAQQLKKDKNRQDTPNIIKEKNAPSYTSISNSHRKDKTSTNEQFEELTNHIQQSFNQSISSLEKFKIELDDLEKIQQQLNSSITLKKSIDQLEDLGKNIRKKYEQ